MKERPILFSAPMVRAILAGTKTQTRRVVKPQPSPNFLGDPIIAVNRLETGSWAAFDDGGIADNGYQWRCPYGQPGDRLWVKETWSAADGWDNTKPLEICEHSPIQYAADSALRFVDAWDDYEPRRYGRLRPSIFMRRWMSRIILEVTGVRVERLNDISEYDATWEGIDIPADHDYVGAYQALWASINGPGSWTANPWVWVVEFRRVQP